MSPGGDFVPDERTQDVMMRAMTADPARPGRERDSVLHEA